MINLRTLVLLQMLLCGLYCIQCNQQTINAETEVQEKNSYLEINWKGNEMELKFLIPELPQQSDQQNTYVLRQSQYSNKIREININNSINLQVVFLNEQREIENIQDFQLEQNIQENDCIFDLKLKNTNFVEQEYFDMRFYNQDQNNVYIVFCHDSVKQSVQGQTNSQYYFLNLIEQQDQNNYIAKGGMLVKDQFNMTTEIQEKINQPIDNLTLQDRKGLFITRSSSSSRIFQDKQITFNQHNNQLELPQWCIVDNKAYPLYEIFYVQKYMKFYQLQVQRESEKSNLIGVYFQLSKTKVQVMAVTNMQRNQLNVVYQQDDLMGTESYINDLDSLTVNYIYHLKARPISQQPQFVTTTKSYKFEGDNFQQGFLDMDFTSSYKLDQQQSQQYILITQKFKKIQESQNFSLEINVYLGEFNYIKSLHQNLWTNDKAIKISESVSYQFQHQQTLAPINSQQNQQKIKINSLHQNLLDIFNEKQIDMITKYLTHQIRGDYQKYQSEIQVMDNNHYAYIEYSEADQKFRFKNIQNNKIFTSCSMNQESEEEFLKQISTIKFRMFPKQQDDQQLFKELKTQHYKHKNKNIFIFYLNDLSDFQQDQFLGGFCFGNIDENKKVELRFIDFENGLLVSQQTKKISKLKIEIQQKIFVLKEGQIQRYKELQVEPYLDQGQKFSQEQYFIIETYQSEQIKTDFGYLQNYTQPGHHIFKHVLDKSKIEKISKSVRFASICMYGKNNILYTITKVNLWQSLLKGNVYYAMKGEQNFLLALKFNRKANQLSNHEQGQIGQKLNIIFTGNNQGKEDVFKNNTKIVVIHDTDYQRPKYDQMKFGYFKGQCFFIYFYKENDERDITILNSYQESNYLYVKLLKLQDIQNDQFDIDKDSDENQVQIKKSINSQRKFTIIPNYLQSNGSAGTMLGFDVDFENQQVVSKMLVDLKQELISNISQIKLKLQNSAQNNQGDFKAYFLDIKDQNELLVI